MPTLSRKIPLEQADAVLQQALEVIPRQYQPVEWAEALQNLGRVFAEQGRWLPGEDEARPLEKAVAAYQHALEMRTREHLPGPWAETHQKLAEAYVGLDDWPKAAISYANVLQVYPDDENAYRSASSLYHE